MTKSPLQLEHYSFTQILVDANKEFGEKSGEGPLAIDPQVQINLSKHKSDPNKFGVSLRISCQPVGDQVLPYNIRLQVVGMFTVSDEIPAAYREQVAVTNGTQMLYGAARDFVFSLTARGPWEPIILPAKVFSDLKKRDAPSTSTKETPTVKATATTKLLRRRKVVQR